MGLKDQILAANEGQSEKVPMPEWECTIEMRSITAADLEAWQWETYQQNKDDTRANKSNLRTRLVVRCAFDPDTGEKVFTDADVDALNLKPSKIIERLYKVAEKLNAVTEKDVNDLAKNS